VLVGELAAAPGEARNARLARVNEAMRRVEQSLLDADGIPGRPWFKHVLYAPKYTYAAMTLPGVQEAVDSGNWSVAKEQLAVLAARLDAAAQATAAAADAAGDR
jgi:N-acetylated-alpha-linked acidic dipeptidase